MPSLRDIAQAAGVSKSTVSLALRNSPRLSATTRERVQRVAREMDYRPGPHLRAFMVGVRRNRRSADRASIALVTFQNKSYWDGRFRFHYQKHIERRAEVLGFTVDLVTDATSLDQNGRLHQILTHRGIGGLIFVGESDAIRDCRLPWEHYSVAMIDDSLRTPSFHSTCNDHFHAVETALTQLTRLGYRRIGYFQPPSDKAFSRTTFGALYNYQAGIAAENRIPPPNRGEFIVDWVRRQRTDAVIVMAAEERIRRMHQHGMQVPESVAVAELALLGDESDIAGVVQPNREIAESAVDRLALLLAHNERGKPSRPTQLLIRGTWRDGSTAPAKTC